MLGVLRGQRAVALQSQCEYHLNYQRHRGWACDLSVCISAAQLRVACPAGRNLCLCEQLRFSWASFHVQRVVAPPCRQTTERERENCLTGAAHPVAQQ